MLKDIQLGPLNVTISAGGKSKSETLRIYSLASFMGDMMATYNLKMDEPVWVQVNGGSIYALDKVAGTTKNRVDVFKYNSTPTPTLELVPTPLSISGALDSNVLLDIVNSKVTRLNQPPQSGQPYSLVYYPDLSKLEVMSLTTLNYTTANALAADRMSTLVAVAGEGMDGSLKAFTVPQAMPVIFNNIQAQPPVFLGWGFIAFRSTKDILGDEKSGSQRDYLAGDATCAAS